MSATAGLITEEIDCPLCGSARYRSDHCGPDYFMHLPGIFQLVRCAECGLIYQNPRPSLKAIERYYPDQYGSYSSAQAGLRAPRGMLRWVIKRGQRKRSQLVDRAIPAMVGQTRRLLDIGCASGLFLEMMQRYPGWWVEGVELNSAAAHATSERLGVPIFNGPFERASYPDATFDAITMWDVLEHLHEPILSLREVRRILKPSGVLFIRVPNAASYVVQLCGRYWSGYDLPRHMTLFTPRTLARALGQAGFGERLCYYTSGSYLAALHSLRFALDDGLVSPARALSIHRALQHPVVRAVVWLPFQLADRLAGGSNIEVMVR